METLNGIVYKLAVDKYRLLVFLASKLLLLIIINNAYFFLKKYLFLNEYLAFIIFFAI